MSYLQQVVDKHYGGILNTLVHNASQIYVPEGDARHPYEVGQPKNSRYGNLLQSQENAKEFVNFTLMNHYSNLYSKCLINFAERSVQRMKDDDGSIIFISSPGCNIMQTVKLGYDMAGEV